MDRLSHSRRPQRRKPESSFSSIPIPSLSRSSVVIRLPNLKLGLMLPLVILITPILAQGQYKILDESVLPSCALTCPQLTEAQKACVPPSAPVTNPATYTSCFCNSNFLTPNLKVGQTTGLCEGQCTSADLGRVQAWYNSLCANPGAATTTAAGGGGPTVTLGPTQKKASSSVVNPSPQSWIQQNYRWVIMAIILILAAIAAIVFGIWFKRRRSKKLPNALTTQDTLNALRDPHPIAPPMTPSMTTPASKGVLSPVSNVSTQNVLGRGTPVSGGPPQIRRDGSGGSAMRATPPPPAHRPQVTQMMSAPNNSTAINTSIYTRPSARSMGSLKRTNASPRSASVERLGFGSGLGPPDGAKGKGRIAELAGEYPEPVASPIPNELEEGGRMIERPSTAPSASVSRAKFDSQDPNRPTVAGYAHVPPRADSVSPGTLPPRNAAR